MRLFVCVLFTAIYPVASWAAPPSEDEILGRCAVNGVVPEKNELALARLLTDPILAANSDGCKAEMSSTERNAYRARLISSAELKLRDLRVIRARSSQNKPAQSTPANTVRSELQIATDEPDIPLIVRDAYTLTTFGALKKAREEADGASFSYTRDFQNDNALTALTGSTYLYKDIFPSPADAATIAPFSRVILASGVEFDQQRDRTSARNNVDYLGARFLAEMHLPGGPFLHIFRGGGAVKSDSRGESKIWNAYAEWQPLSNTLGFSTGKTVWPDSALYYRFDPVVHFEHEHVASAGVRTDISDGDRYTRAGVILQGSLWFVSGPDFLRRMTLSGQYRALWGTSDPGRFRDIRYWQGTFGYNIDEAGHAQIKMTYRHGNLPGNGQEVREFKTGFGVKF